ncbi:hypothetical protein EML15_05215 [Corynebacterium sp. sy017]|uniref:hypothetical protein n=1 Tax=unclassified Corynebacterium TaxID=2624378 RepID=UPI0011850938|nr:MULTISPECIES: hypothetical protein [unclassified Corynebacterium]MBP3088545.1 hypothetical protein [Corynebacterium sp. sy017]TSD91846.1 hypothetical protein ELY17_05215 [Corynebacterium sp. SY003]
MSYAATGAASILAVLIISFCAGYVQLWALCSAIAARLICAALIARLPAIDSRGISPQGMSARAPVGKDGSAIDNPKSLTETRNKVSTGYIFITICLFLISSLCGSFTFLLPLIAAKFSITGDKLYPILLGAMTIFAGILHRNKTVRNLALHKGRKAVTYCLLGAGIAFGALYYSLRTDTAISLLLSASAIIALTFCNVVVMSVQWEYSYRIRHQETTRMYEATDSLLQTSIGLCLPSSLSFLLGIFSLNIFLGIGLMFIGSALVQLFDVGAKKL